MLIIFDLDNTLIDRDAAFLLCLKGMFQQQGCDFQIVDIENVKIQDDSGRNDRAELCEYLSRKYPMLGLSSDEVWRCFQSLPAHVVKNHSVNAMLARLSRDYTLCLLSNGSSSMQRRKLVNAGIEHLFSDIFISGELGISKPDIAIFEHVLERYDVSACDCIMVGDDPVRDIEPAKKIGLCSIWLDKNVEVGIPENRGIGTYHHQINHIKDVEKAILRCLT